MNHIESAFKKYMGMVYPTVKPGSDQYNHSERIWYCAYLDCATAIVTENNASPIIEESSSWVSRDVMAELIGQKQ